MNMIENHMEQIALSSAAILKLPFPPPKIFTNSLLHPHDITSLIRDTEAHERALFKVAPPEPGSFEPVARRKTIHSGADGLKGSNAYPGLKPTTAVGRILGGDFLERMRRNERDINRERQNVDVEVLLKGAEKLPVPGVLERIQSLRSRHATIAASVADLEAQISTQSAQLNRMNRSRDDIDTQPRGETEEDAGEASEMERRRFSIEEFAKEEEEMQELEEKRRGLQDRVSGMEKDLDGLNDR
ncbi:MAG: hypothetical protein MMC23_008454 [Stictis urceolatum]|nr:hypothetical protein [Stictis urceolata]